MNPKVVFDERGLEVLIRLLGERGYRVIGPVVRDGAIVYDEIESAADLPRGWTDEQGPGSYRLRRRDDGAVFGYAVGPHSWKRFLFPPRTTLWRARRGGLEVVSEDVEEPPRFAFIGVRPCELRAIEIQDRVFLGGAYADPTYAGRRAPAFVVAAACADPAQTCFCASMDAGPDLRDGFDVALTEVDGRYFVAVAGSEEGRDVLDAIPHRAALPEEIAAADAVTERARSRMTRAVGTSGLAERLAERVTSERWEEIATRCLACANCTMVCPTCFCSTVEDSTDLTGGVAERARRWDSCFTLDFSTLGPGSVRASTGARYRQWLTHKLSSWVDQFGSFGCVGCGRCIAWCPAGIDITAEIDALVGTQEA